MSWCCTSSPEALKSQPASFLAEIYLEAGGVSGGGAIMSRYGADYYGLPYNRGRVRLERKSWTLPESLPYPEASLIPFRAGETLRWKQIVDA